MRTAFSLAPQADARGDHVEHVEHVRDAERARALLESLARHGAAGQARKEGAAVPLRLEHCAGGTVTLRCDERVEPPFAIELCGYNAMFHFAVDHSVWHEGRLRAAAPDELRYVRRRWLKRHDVLRSLTATCPATLEADPFQAELVNVSYEGMALHAAAPLVERVPGDRLSGLTIGTGSRAAQVDVEVCWVRPAAGDGGSDYGLKVTRSDLRWLALVNEQLYPGTEVGSAHVEEIWALFEASGMFELPGKSAEDFRRLRRFYFGVSRQLEHAPQLGSLAVWRTRDRVVATAAMSRIYQGTWVGHHLAKRPGEAPDGTSGRRVLRELMCRLYEQVQHDRDFRWFLTYVEARDIWMRYAFLENAGQHVGSGDAAIVPVRMLELDTVASSVGGLDRIAAATTHERELLADHLARTRSAAYVDALDLGRDNICIGAARRLWSREGLERDRAVMVAREGGRVVAAAIVECCAKGVHLHNLFDAVRLYVLEPGGERHHAALLEAARSWFRDLGRTTMVLLEEKEARLPAALRSRARELGRADMVIFAARRVPEMLETLHELTAP